MPRRALLAALAALILVSTGLGAPGELRAAPSRDAAGHVGRTRTDAGKPTSTARRRRRTRKRRRGATRPRPAAPTIATPAPAPAAPAPAAPAAPAPAPTGPPAALPGRIAAGSAGLIDAAGLPWSSDAHFIGGQPVATTHAIAGTATPALYQHGRLGASGYAIRVPRAATYSVTLFLAETRGAAAGARSFDVTAEGATVAADVDAAGAVGPYAAHHVVFSVSVADGTLDLGFLPRSGIPLVSGIDVEPYRATTGPGATLLAQEFDGPVGSRPDPSVWTPDVGGAGWGNDELEYYTGRSSNAALDGQGNLVITARREAYTGADGVTRDYTSARLTTYDAFAFTYGRMQARIQVPSGQGLWPAFWSVGDRTYRHDDWPGGGEIDVMEVLGQSPDTVHGTVHGPDAAGAAWQYGRTLTAPASLAGDYHTYEVLWVPNAVQASLDGRAYMTITPTDLPADQRWVLDQPNFLLLDLAVGGRWPGPPDAATAFPAALKVDYVRVTR